MVTTRRTPHAGFTIIEMMVATMIMIGVTGAIFALMNPAQGTYQTQPEVSDMQQRLRIGVDTLTKDIIMAGAGSYMGSNAGALYNYFAPIMPYRSGELNPDAASGVFYRSDTITLMYVPPTPAQTTVVKNEGGANSQELVVQAQKNCGTDQHNQLCGFHDTQHVLVYDVDGSWDTTILTNIQDEALHLQHNDKLSSAYDSGLAQLTEVATHTYYLKSDTTSNTYQLMHYDGGTTPDQPVVDNVVKLAFNYYGDPQPPLLIPGKSLCDASVKGPFTTYGPKPPCLAKAGTGGYLAGENCAFKVVNGTQVPRMDVLTGTSGQVELTQSMLTDGPWCPGESSENYPNRFDADLLRIRRVKVTLRVQAALAVLRGPTGVLFTHGGSSPGGQRFVPDQEISFSVTPRNMTLGR